MMPAGRSRITHLIRRSAHRAAEGSQDPPEKREPGRLPTRGFVIRLLLGFAARAQDHEPWDGCRWPEFPGVPVPTAV